jgi:hypothetical protein
MKKNIPSLIFLAAFALQPCAAEEETSPMFFTLINTVPESTGFSCYIRNSKETNVLTPPVDAVDDAAGNGFSTGLVTWTPSDGDLVAEVPGRAPVSLRPFIKPGESPLVILKAGAGGSLAFSMLPKAADRSSGFYDAVNLTVKPELELTVDGRKVKLPRGERVRLSSKSKTLSYELPGGPKDVLESMDDPSHVMVFYGDDKGATRCMVVADFAP